MSEVKVNKITPTTNCGTVTLGDSGDTVAIPCGVTLSNSGSITNSGTITNTGTISGGTITGTIDNQVNWDTTAKTAGFTAVAGNGYFVNTTSGAITVTLPATPSAGDLVGIKDYANTANTNNITIDRNGSNIQGTANNFTISVAGTSITLIYVDGTQGWVSTGAAKASDIAEQAFFVTATGGTITTCGDYKVHTFTGPGTFCVSCAGNAVGSDTVDYLVVAGGGGGGGGGGGAGGFRVSNSYGLPAPTMSPLSSPTGLSVSVTAYPITVGGGGSAGSQNSGGCAATAGGCGSSSIFSTITSAAGGGGGSASGGSPTTGGGRPGGSGGGNGHDSSARPVATGNTPPVSPPQGNNGGICPTDSYGAGAGGGGAGAVGNNQQSPNNIAGPGGNGSYVSPSLAPSNGTPGPVGSTKYFAGGGGGGNNTGTGTGFSHPTGGAGGGGQGGKSNPSFEGPDAGSPGTANTGGAGGGHAHATNATGGAGGSGIVIIRYKYQ